MVAAVPNICKIQDTTRYPTWIIDGRRFAGVVLEPADLARCSGFQGREGE